MVSIPDLPAAVPAYLQRLNPPQREAVETLDGPVLVLAGAGTGKTRVLTTRLAHLLATRRATPMQIMAVTFTNKAAREMRERVAALVGAPAEGWWLGTFHALAARILRRHAERVGLKPTFTILDTDDQLRLVKQLLQAESIDDRKSPPRAVLAVIERWKDKGLTPDRLSPGDGGATAGGRMVHLYRAYQERLRTLNACDFGDLLLHGLTLFRDNPDVLAEYHRRLRYLLVDEYQDTNVAQYLWLRLLAQGHKNICCVGDDDQSIYGWRGAEVGNILRFEQDFPGAKVIRLEQNYRSTGHILAAAGGIIAHNQGRLGKTLWTAADGGEAVRVRGLWDGDDEARFVGDEIEAFQRAGTAARDMAVLVRAGFQTRAFEERFLALGLPYRVIGGPRFYERAEIRDAVAYLRVVAVPDDDLAFERIINTPKRGIGAAALQQLHAIARTDRVPLSEAARILSLASDTKGRLRTTLAGLVADFDRWRTALATTPHPDLTRIILDESGYTAMWQADPSPDAPGRLENLKELIGAMAEFETLTGFLEHVALVAEAAEGAEGDVVSLMTLHGAKGLEFDVVFLPGWEEGVFPNQRALDETGIAGLEEERRLAYVGITRARRRAIISFAANRRIHGTWTSSLPSRFIEELPDADCEVETDPGLFGGRVAEGYGAGYHGSAGGGFGARQPPARVLPVERAPAWRGPTIEARAVSVPERKRPAQPFAVGARVFHQKFGYGTVEAVDNDKLDVQFDHTGRKKIMDSFVVAASDAGSANS